MVSNLPHLTSRLHQLNLFCAMLFRPRPIDRSNRVPIVRRANFLDQLWQRIQVAIQTGQWSAYSWPTTLKFTSTFSKNKKWKQTQRHSNERNWSRCTHFVGTVAGTFLSTWTSSHDSSGFYRRSITLSWPWSVARALIPARWSAYPLYFYFILIALARAVFV